MRDFLKRLTAMAGFSTRLARVPIERGTQPQRKMAGREPECPQRSSRESTAPGADPRDPLGFPLPAGGRGMSVKRKLAEREHLRSNRLCVPARTGRWLQMKVRHFGDLANHDDRRSCVGLAKSNEPGPRPMRPSDTDFRSENAITPGPQSASDATPPSPVKRRTPSIPVLEMLFVVPMGRSLVRGLWGAGERHV
jgi:hypothetical protein